MTAPRQAGRESPETDEAERPRTEGSELRREREKEPSETKGPGGNKNDGDKDGQGKRRDRNSEPDPEDRRRSASASPPPPAAPKPLRGKELGRCAARAARRRGDARARALARCFGQPLADFKRQAEAGCRAVARRVKKNRRAVVRRCRRQAGLR